MIVGCILFETIPDVLLSFFNASEQMLDIGVPALRTIGLHFPIAAVSIVLITTLQALGYAFYSMLVSMGRQLLVLLPAAYILAKLGGLPFGGRSDCGTCGGYAMCPVFPAGKTAGDRPAGCDVNPSKKNREVF